MANKTSDRDASLPNLLKEIRGCRVCESSLELGPRPILEASIDSKILIVGQAPGRRVHESGIPWNDPSGVRLREWMGISQESFYDPRLVAIVPMGFCYPGKGKSGDLPPRPECAELWHERVFEQLPNVELTLIIGTYAQSYLLQAKRGKNLTETVRAWKDFRPRSIPLPHPSPRNIRWFKNNPWFGDEVVPYLRRKVKAICKSL